MSHPEAALPCAAEEPPALSLHCDPESRAWLQALRGEGPARDAAIARLHLLLRRAARFEAGRRAARMRGLDPVEFDDIVTQSADDALVAVLAKLDRYRGHSRFTTWAYKFALLETAVKFRRRPWQEREIPLEAGSWPHAALEDPPGAAAEQAELLAAIGRGIRHELTPHQRRTLIAVAVNGVPIDVLAERLGSTRGALYKTIHDARDKLRAHLQREGFEPPAGHQGAPL